MSDRPGGTGRRVAIGVMHVVVTGVLIAVVWQVADGPAAVAALATAQPGWLLLALALLLCHTVLAALRWRVTAAPLGIQLARGVAVREYFLAQVINSAVPGGMVGDAARAVRSRRDAGFTVAAVAVVIERALGVAALLCALAIGFAVTIAVPTAVTWSAALVVSVSILLAGAVVAAITLVITVRRANPPDDGRWGRILEGVRVAGSSPGVVRAQAALSAGTTICILAAFACCAAAVGAPLPVSAVFAVVPLVLLAMVLPVSVGGWGVREGAAVALLPIAGLTAADAFATSIAFGLVALVAALPGVWVIVAGRSPDRRSVPGSKNDRQRHPAPVELSEESS